MTKISLEDVADYLEDYHPYTGYSTAICPWHDDHGPSLFLGENGYKCKSCGAKGSLVKLYEHVSGKIVIREKRKFNPSALIWDKWKERFGSIQQIVKMAHNNLKQNPELGHYLETRKIDSEIKKLYIGYLDGYYTIPIRNEYDEVEGIVARASPTIQTKNNRYSVSPNCKTKLYIPNWRNTLQSQELYVCYGVIDSVSLSVAGYAGVSGLSGQGLSYEHLERFRKPIYIIPDLGEEKSAMNLQTDLGWRGRVLFLEWPDGCKDINAVHVMYGIDKVIELIEKAKERYIYEENCSK